MQKYFYPVPRRDRAELQHRAIQRPLVRRSKAALKGGTCPSRPAPRSPEVETRRVRSETSRPVPHGQVCRARASIRDNDQAKTHRVVDELQEMPTFTASP